VAKVLVIDDEQGIRDLLDTLLRRKGLELFRRERPDVVVLDLKMPGMDGLAVLQQVRSLDPRMPVIILTGAGTPETEQQVRAMGVDGVRRKRILAASPGGLAEASAQDSQPCAVVDASLSNRATVGHGVCSVQLR